MRARPVGCTPIVFALIISALSITACSNSSGSLPTTTAAETTLSGAAPTVAPGAAQKSLDHPMFQMEVNAGIIDMLRRFEDHGQNGILLAPLPDLLVLLSRSAEGIECVIPGGRHLGERPASGLLMTCNGLQFRRLVEFPRQ